MCKCNREESTTCVNWGNAWKINTWYVYFSAIPILHMWCDKEKVRRFKKWLNNQFLHREGDHALFWEYINQVGKNNKIYMKLAPVSRHSICIESLWRKAIKNYSLLESSWAFLVGKRCGCWKHSRFDSWIIFFWKFG